MVAAIYSYIVRVDQGSAPNPFGSYCTLALCKPMIRKCAKPNDWIVGFAAKGIGGTYENPKVIYFMKVDRVLPFEKYESFCKQNCPIKIPNVSSRAYEKTVGDCQYVWRNGKVHVLPGVHGESSKEDDLSGKHVLIAKDFVYFGSEGVPIDDDLRDVGRIVRGHRSPMNQPFFDAFEKWAHRQIKKYGNGYVGKPNHVFKTKKIGGCA